MTKPRPAGFALTLGEDARALAFERALEYLRAQGVDTDALRAQVREVSEPVDDDVQAGSLGLTTDEVLQRYDAARAWLASKPEWWREAYDEAYRRDKGAVREERRARVGLGCGHAK